jgi:hypothetical protein
LSSTSNPVFFCENDTETDNTKLSDATMNNKGNISNDIQDSLGIISPLLPEDLQKLFERTQDSSMEQAFSHLLDNESNILSTLEYETLLSPSSNTNSHLGPYEVQSTPVTLVNEETLAEKFDEKKSKKEKKMVQEISPDRLWEPVHLLKMVKNVEIQIKTRTETPSPAMPDRVYSSLKYSLFISVELGDDFPKENSFILARVHVVHADTCKKVTKVEKPLKGQVEVALTRISSRTSLEGRLMIQFGDLSYHKDQQNYRLEVHFFLPNNTHTPIQIMRSSAFRVYARKPNKKKFYGSQKRKRELDVHEIEYQKKTRYGQEFSTFVQKLENLLELKDKLSLEEQRFAVQLVLSKFTEIAPTVYSIPPMQNWSTIVNMNQPTRIEENVFQDFFS